MRWGWCLALLLLPLIACERGFQTFDGKVASSGPGLGTWAATPEGCSRDPIDGKPLGQTASIVSFYWEDPADHDVRLRNHAAARAPDVPQQLDVVRDGDGIAGRMKTVKRGGFRFDRKDCEELSLESSEEPAGYAGGRATLRGRLRLDCEVQGSRLTADVTFRRCEY